MTKKMELFSAKLLPNNFANELLIPDYMTVESSRSLCNDGMAVYLFGIECTPRMYITLYTYIYILYSYTLHACFNWPSD